MKRKTVKVVLEIYEDQEQEFRRLIYILKHGLKDKSWYTVNKRLLLTKDDDINMSDEEFIEKKISNSEKRYLELLKYLSDMVYVRSTDSKNPIPSISLPIFYNIRPEAGQPSIPIYLDKVSKEQGTKEVDLLKRIEEWKGKNNLGKRTDSETEIEKWKKENRSNKEHIENKEKKIAYEDIETFLNRSKFIKPNLSDYLFGELCNWILFAIEHMKPIKMNTDEFFLAAVINSKDVDMLSKLPGVLNRGWMASEMYGFRYGANVSFDDRKKINDYILTERIFDNLKFNFPVLRQPKTNDYQLRIITGYVISAIGIIKDQDIFLKESKGSKDWRNYLAEKVEAYHFKYNTLYKNGN